MRLMYFERQEIHCFNSNTHTNYNKSNFLSKISIYRVIDVQIITNRFGKGLKVETNQQLPGNLQDIKIRKLSPPTRISNLLNLFAYKNCTKLEIIIHFYIFNLK